MQMQTLLPFSFICSQSNKIILLPDSVLKPLVGFEKKKEDEHEHEHEDGDNVDDDDDNDEHKQGRRLEMGATGKTSSSIMGTLLLRVCVFYPDHFYCVSF